MDCQPDNEINIDVHKHHDLNPDGRAHCVSQCIFSTVLIEDEALLYSLSSHPMTGGSIQRTLEGRQAMINKHTRVLILDDSHAQSLLIEKMLNVMGYYCIACVTTAKEGAALSWAGQRKFDALIASEHLLDLHNYQSPLIEKFSIVNLFVYSCGPHDHDLTLRVSGTTCYRTGLPEYRVLEEFMASLVPHISVRTSQHPVRTHAR